MRALCERLKLTIEKGDLGVANWDPSASRVKEMEVRSLLWSHTSTETDQHDKFLISPRSKRPVAIALRQMSTPEASRFTVNHITKVRFACTTHHISYLLFTPIP